MKVVHVSVSDIKGGAARAAYRLHQGLLQAGLSSSMVVAEKYSVDDAVIVPVRDRRGYYERRLHYRQLSARFWRSIPSRPQGLSPFTHPSTSRNRELTNKLPNADIINLHWIAHFVDLPTFFNQTKAPVVWTLHDMNAFTGGCHCALNCERYRDHCGACPQLGSTSNRDVSREIWMAKRDIYGPMAKDRLHIVTPSFWLAEKVRESPLLKKFPTSVVPNGLDTAIFSPGDKKMARSALGIPQTAKVLLFVASSLTVRHKGFAYLLSAINDIDQSNLFFVSVGSGHPTFTYPNYLPMGRISDERRMALLYQAADVFAIPSLQENYPNTALESLSCGTPVVGFDVGGVGEMVRDGETGLLARPRDIRRLREALVTLLVNDAMRKEFGENSRQIAAAEYDFAVQARRYLALYRQILGQEHFEDVGSYH